MEKMGADIRELYEAAVKVREYSYSPYSHFAVGTAVRTAGGRIFSGCNIENSSYGISCCAERNAIFAAVGSGCRDIEAICVTADTPEPVSPCGACRQVMAEFRIGKIIMANMKGDFRICTLEEVLPFGFEL